MINRIKNLLPVNGQGELPDSLRQSEPYREGLKAYCVGVMMGGDIEPECPYSVRDGRRTAWWAGWYDGRIVDRLGHIFEAHGLTYP